MTGCPSSELLERLLEDQLDADSRHTLTRHVDACTSCQTRLERMTQDSLDSLPTRRPATPPVCDSRTVFLQRLKSRGPAAVRADPAGSGAPSWPAVPGYEIVRELGRGGMGVVYLARQAGLNRPVALKMMRAGPGAHHRERQRFAREAEAVARLRHPNIVHIYDVGECQNAPYLALEYIEGSNLGDCLRGNPQPIEVAGRLIETLARAVHHAHGHGVVHRDLKPANVLLRQEAWRGQEPHKGTPEEELLAQAVSDSALVKITDFGLAKRLDDPHSRTGSEDIIGTPSYMAPEQAGGPPHRVGPPADTYALGAILYEMLTGRPPFKGTSTVDTVLQVLHREPVRPGSLRPDLPRDLETICLTCLAKDPARRYPTAEALADDLTRFRRGKPIAARPVGPLERAAKWARRHPLPAGLLASLILVGVLGFAGVSWQWRKAAVARDRLAEEKRQKEEEREQAERARGEATEQRKQARVALYASRIAQSRLSWRVNDLHSARQALEKCIPVGDQEDRRGWEWYYLQRLFRSDLYALSHRQGGTGGGVTHWMKGDLMASVLTGLSEGGVQSELRIWKAATGEPVLVKGLSGAGQRLAFAPDGAHLALAGTDGNVTILDSATGGQRRRWKAHALEVTGVSYSPDGRKLVTSSHDGWLTVWDASSGVELRTLRGHTDKVQDLAYSPGGDEIASASWDGTVRLWDPETGQLRKTFQGHNAPVFSLAYAPDARLLASAAQNGNVKIWDLKTGHAMQSVNGLAGAVLNLAFNPDGRYIGYGGSDNTVRVWDVELGVERAVFRGHTAPVECVDFSPDGQRLVSCSPRDGVVMGWDLTRNPESAVFSRTGADVEAVAFSGDGLELRTVTRAGRLQRWDRAAGLLVTEHALALPAPDAVAFSPAGDLLAARARESAGLVRVWDAVTGLELLTLAAHTGSADYIHFSRDGRLLATAGTDQKANGPRYRACVWDVKGHRLATCPLPARPVSLAFRPAGGHLAWSTADGSLGLFHWPTGRTVAERMVHKGAAQALAFSPDGNWLALAAEDEPAVELRELVAGPDEGKLTWGEVRSVPAPRQVRGLAYSPDGRRLAGVTRDVVKVWDPESRLEMLTLRGAPQRYWDGPFNPRVLFSPDGAGLVGTNWNESISLWEAETPGEVPEPGGGSSRLTAARAAFWHLQEAEQCLEYRNHHGARFHLQRVANATLSRPLQARKERLERALTGGRPSSGRKVPERQTRPPGL